MSKGTKKKKDKKNKEKTKEKLENRDDSDIERKDESEEPDDASDASQHRNRLQARHQVHVSSKYLIPIFSKKKLSPLKKALSLPPTKTVSAYGGGLARQSNR